MLNRQNPRSIVHIPSGLQITNRLRQFIIIKKKKTRKMSEGKYQETKNTDLGQ